jgi:thioredoxin reductase
VWLYVWYLYLFGMLLGQSTELPQQHTTDAVTLATGSHAKKLQIKVSTARRFFVRPVGDFTPSSCSYCCMRAKLTLVSQWR